MEAVRALLAAGAEVGVRDDRNWTAALLAAQGGTAGHRACVKLLLDAGASVDEQGGLAGHGDRHAEGFGALHWAAWRGDLALTELLLARGAAPDLREGGYARRTPLMLAARWAHRGVLRALLAGKADPAALDARGLSAEEQALRFHCIFQVRPKPRVPRTKLPRHARGARAQVETQVPRSPAEMHGMPLTEWCSPAPPSRSSQCRASVACRLY